MIAAQGGDPDAPLPQPAERHVVAAPATGTLTRLDAYAVGVAAWRLGAGRARKEDPVSAAAGVDLDGDRGGAGDRGPAAARAAHRRRRPASRARWRPSRARSASTPTTAPLPLLLDRITR